MKKLIIYIRILFVINFIMGIISCEQKEFKLQPLVKIGQPDPDNTTARSAEIEGDILDVGEGIEQHGHCFSTHGDPTVNDPNTQLGGISSPGSYASILQNLEPGATYYVKAYVISQGSAYYSAVKSVKTLSGVADVITNSPDSVFVTGAICGGSVTSVNGDELLSKGLCWHTANNVDLNNFLGKSEEGSDLGLFSTEIEDLEAGAEYFVRAYGITSVDTTYGEIKFFRTNHYSPLVETLEATEKTTTSARLNGRVNARGAIASVTFLYRLITSSDWETVTATPSTVEGDTFTSVHAEIDNLQAGAEYAFRVSAVSEGGTANGELNYFIVDIPPPDVTTKPATSITSTSAILNGTVNSYGWLTDVIFECRLSGSDHWQPIESNPSELTEEGPVNVTATLNGLQSAKTYYFRVRAFSDGGESIGEELEFSTVCLPPTVSSISPSNISNNGALLKGEVESRGCSIVARGFYLDRYDSSPDSGDEVISAGSGSGFFTAWVKTLQPGIRYYVRAWAENSEGDMSTGVTKTFTTPEDEPLLEKELVFYEPFNDNANNWYLTDTLYDSEGYYQKAEIVNGRYEYAWNKPPGHFRYSYNELGAVSGDFEIEVELGTFEKLESEPITGIFFLNSLYAKFFYFYAEDQFIDFFVEERATGERTYFDGAYSDNLNPLGAYSVIKIAINDGQTFIYINGKKEEVAFDFDNGLTHIGVISGRAESHFNWIKVYAEKGAVSSSPLKSGKKGRERIMRLDERD